MGKKIKDIRSDLRCDFLYYSGYRECLLDVMKKVMEVDKKKSKEKKKKHWFIITYVLQLDKPVVTLDYNALITVWIIVNMMII